MLARIATFFCCLLLAPTAWAQDARIIAFGDSITRGFGDAGTLCDSTPAGYPSRLPALLANDGLNVTAINEGICFETTNSGLSRIGNVLDSRGGNIVVIMEGTNDISMGTVSINTMRFNLSEMARKAEERGIVPITVSPIPRGPGAGSDESNSRTAIIAGWLELDTGTLNRVFADAFNILFPISNLFNVYYADAFHPNASGYDLLAQIIREPIVEVLTPDPDPDPAPYKLTCPAVPDLTPCVPSEENLCLRNNRFRLEASWRNFQNETGVGHAQDQTADTGDFWFFDPDNIELIVKVLDGRNANGFFWVYYGALSNVDYSMRVTDTQTGACKIYDNPSGTFASVGDNRAFASDTNAQTSTPYPEFTDVAEFPDIAGLTDITEPPPQMLGGACVPSQEVLCLGDGRFQLTVEWTDFRGNTGTGTAATLTSDTGYFWFFKPSNVELVVKMLDGTNSNGNYWVFYGALSNVAYTMTVTDLETGVVRTYVNPLGVFASVGDTEAFPIGQP